MILLIEPDKSIRKKLGDLLSRERIICVANTLETMEMVCKFKNRLRLIIANICYLHKIISNQTLFRLCQKLYFETPPILAYFKKSDKKLKDKFEKNYRDYKLIEFDEKDKNFPECYIQAVKELHPDVIADIDQARTAWQKKEKLTEPKDMRTWLKQEGFIDAVEMPKQAKPEKEIHDIMTTIEKVLSEEIAGKKQTIGIIKVDKSYKEMYIELKKKYDKLLKHIIAWSILLKKHKKEP